MATSWTFFAFRLNGQFAEYGAGYVTVFDSTTDAQCNMHVKVLKRFKFTRPNRHLQKAVVDSLRNRSRQCSRVPNAESLDSGVERCRFYSQQCRGSVWSVDLVVTLRQGGADVFGFEGSQFFVGQDALLLGSPSATTQLVK